MIKADRKLHTIPIEEIQFIESEREYVAVHLKGGRRILSLMPLYQMEATLADHNFIRIHRSFIIPISKVTAANLRFVFLGKKRFRVGGSYRKIVEEKLLTN